MAGGSILALSLHSKSLHPFPRPGSRAQPTWPRVASAPAAVPLWCSFRLFLAQAVPTLSLVSRTQGQLCPRSTTCPVFSECSIKLRPSPVGRWVQPWHPWVCFSPLD